MVLRSDLTGAWMCRLSDDGTHWGQKKSEIATKISCHTGKFASEALSLESVNPQYSNRHWLLTSVQEKYKFRTCCVQKLFWMPKKQTKNNSLYTTCSELVFFLYWSQESMNNLSYRGLTDSRMSASEKDLPVLCFISNLGWKSFY